MEPEGSLPCSQKLATSRNLECENIVFQKTNLML